MSKVLPSAGPGCEGCYESPPDRLHDVRDPHLREVGGHGLGGQHDVGRRHEQLPHLLRARDPGQAAGPAAVLHRDPRHVLLVLLVFTLVNSVYPRLFFLLLCLRLKILLNCLKIWRQLVRNSLQELKMYPLVLIVHVTIVNV